MEPIGYVDHNVPKSHEEREEQTADDQQPRMFVMDGCPDHINIALASRLADKNESIWKPL